MTNTAGEIKSRILPNTTQTPNLYLDHYMAFLTGDEWKILTYTVRRIMGFQKQTDRISISQYAHGTKDKDGAPLDFGTGLSEQSVGSILKKLISFGFIVEIDGDKGNQGKCYGLQLDDTKIRGDLLTARSVEEKARNKKRTESMRRKASEKRERPQSDRPPLEAGETSVGQTSGGQSDRPQVVSRTDTQKKVETKKKDILANTPGTDPYFVFQTIDGKSVYTGPFKALEAAKRFSAGHGTVTQRQAIPPGATIRPVPKVIQPWDALGKAVARVFFGATDDASVNAVYGRVAPILHGDKRSGRCIGIIEYECQRQKLARDALDYEALAAFAPVVWAYYQTKNPDKPLKDCAKILDYWQARRALDIPNVSRAHFEEKGPNPYNPNPNLSNLRLVES